MLVPLGALTAPHGTRSSVNAGLSARAPDRISFASISKSVLSTPASLAAPGGMEVVDQYGRSFRHTQNEGLHCLTARSLASFDGRQRACDRRNRKRINRARIALWDQRWIHPTPGTSLSEWVRKNSSSNVL
jgi:hypothetical protein